MHENVSARMMGMIWGNLWIHQALYVAAKLFIADLLAAGAKTCEELATAARVQAQPLRRMLCALASVGVFREDDQGRFELTPLAAMLRTDVAGSLHAMAVVSGAPWHLQAWSACLESVQTGQPGWNIAFGKSIFQYLAGEPEKAALFNHAMTSFSAQEAEGVVAAYDFAGADTIVDVGGGHGLLLATVLRANARARGVLLDIAAVVAGAPALLAREGVAGRVEIAPGNFLHAVPAGGDLYVLKNVIHDWDDEKSILILKNCREAMSAAGKILVIQEVLPPSHVPSFGRLMDLQMMLVGGQERTEHEYRALFAAASLTLSRVVPTSTPLAVMELTRS